MTLPHLLRVALTTALALALWSGTAAADIAAAGSATWPGRTGTWVFEVTRDGDPIGTQTVTITEEGDEVTAVTESRIAVKLLGIVVYRFNQVITERYQGPRLVALHAETKDPDGLRVVDIKRDGRDRWTGTLDKKPISFDCDCMASTMWQRASVAATRMIEASQGRPQSISAAEQGRETLDLPEGPAAATRFDVTGGIERKVWFDAAGNLVAAEQFGRDGSLIRQDLVSGPSQASPGASEAAAE